MIIIDLNDLYRRLQDLAVVDRRNHIMPSWVGSQKEVSPRQTIKAAARLSP
jgi:hypothetical protein